MTDAHLNSNQYNWLSSIFYFGYLLAEWPQNWALQRFPVGKWLAGNLVVWHVLHLSWNNGISVTNLVEKGRNHPLAHPLQQLCDAFCCSLFPWGSRSIHRSSIPAFHVHVLYLWRAGRHDAGYVVNW